MKGFRLNEVCTTEKGVRYVATSERIDEIWGVQEIEYSGIVLMPEEYSSREVVVSANTLLLDGHLVFGYFDSVRQFHLLSHNIPRYYVIRSYDEQRGFHSFQCGFDLLNDGRAWEGLTRTEYDSIADALKFIRERLGDGFTIHLEEPMILS
jgi:hypothetical protein